MGEILTRKIITFLLELLLYQDHVVESYSRSDDDANRTFSHATLLRDNIQSAEPEGPCQQPLLFGANSQSMNYWKRHAQDDGVQCYVGRDFYYVEYWPIDGGADSAPISLDGLVLEQGDEEECDNPRCKDGEYYIGRSFEPWSCENAFVKEHDGDFDAKDGETVEELRYE